MAVILRDRDRAQHAWAQVDDAFGSGEPVSDKYRTLARSMPAMIQTAGIGQAVAFLHAKSKEDAHKDYLLHLARWLFDAKGMVPWSEPQAGTGPDALTKALTSEPEVRVWWAVESEAVAYGLWLKRFAEARSEMKKTRGSGAEPEDAPSGQHEERTDAAATRD